MCSRHKVCHGEEDERESGNRPCENCPASPFDDFAEIVGVRDIFVEAFHRNVVAGAVFLAEIADDVV